MGKLLVLVLSRRVIIHSPVSRGNGRSVVVGGECGVVGGSRRVRIEE